MVRLMVTVLKLYPTARSTTVNGSMENLKRVNVLTLMENSMKVNGWMVNLRAKALRHGLMEGNTMVFGKLESPQGQERKFIQMEESRVATGTRGNSQKAVRLLVIFLTLIEPPEGFVSDAGVPEGGSGQNDVDDKVINIENKQTANLMNNLQFN